MTLPDQRSGNRDHTGIERGNRLRIRHPAAPLALVVSAVPTGDELSFVRQEPLDRSAKQQVAVDEQHPLVTLQPERLDRMETGSLAHHLWIAGIERVETRVQIGRRCMIADLRDDGFDMRPARCVEPLGYQHHVAIEPGIGRKERVERDKRTDKIVVGRHRRETEPFHADFCAAHGRIPAKREWRPIIVPTVMQRREERKLSGRSRFA